MQEEFKAHLVWLDNSSENVKNHIVHFIKDKSIQVSAAKKFKGDAALLNPEEMILSSLMSCHMMSYQYVCNQAGIKLLSYEDEASLTLELASDGSGRITKATLKPICTIAITDDELSALQLHDKAHQLCFIANSCNFPIDIKPSIIQA